MSTAVVERNRGTESLRFSWGCCNELVHFVRVVVRVAVRNLCHYNSNRSHGGERLLIVNWKLPESIQLIRQLVYLDF